MFAAGTNSANADIIVLINPTTFELHTGEIGSFDVSMSTTASIDLVSYQVELQANDPGITFSNVTAASSNYVFPGGSADGLIPGGIGTNDLVVIDQVTTFPQNVSTGTYQLFHVTFTVDRSLATGTYTIAIVPTTDPSQGGTYFGVSNSGTPGYIVSLQSNSATLNYTSVPEPSTMVMGGLLVITGGLVTLRKVSHRM